VNSYYNFFTGMRREEKGDKNRTMDGVSFFARVSGFKIVMHRYAHQSIVGLLTNLWLKRRSLSPIRSQSCQKIMVGDIYCGKLVRVPSKTKYLTSFTFQLDSIFIYFDFFFLKKSKFSLIFFDNLLGSSKNLPFFI
jgi:hypothetical protein